ncbi:hypothetical protein H5125_14655 [Shewanella sp. SR44-4]|uniref:hypothetical protein n=1 Tax=Shewanella sp. SR44-4 TaxID=2760935 RepID=UPI001600F1DF|nr:hypothetical protein [Shewanella sp. SR44-4]MBB1363384.1 hypothetical protein [Shewanella sp. SR44-4]
MVSKYRLLIRNFSYAILSNLVSVIISLIVILILPKFLDLEGYGYFQLYIFYTTFVGIFHFGVNDGVYLRLGGKNYNDVDSALYFHHFYILIFSQLIILSLLLLNISFFELSADKYYILIMTGFCMVVVNARYMLIFILQATFRVKEYSLIIILDRFFFLSSVVVFVFCGVKKYEFYIVADIVCKLISLFIAVFYCKNLIINRFKYSVLKCAFSEFSENLRVGSKLMMSNVASKLVIGNVRFAVELAWTVTVFGKISLMLSVTSFIMIFINSVSMVLFPFLRRLNEEKLKVIYLNLRSAISILVFFFLVLYYPVYKFLNFWLPSYADVFQYLYIVFPTIIFEGKMSLLVNTYLKVLRKEVLLLQVNVVAVLLSLLFSVTIVFLFSNVGFALLLILILTMLRVIVFEVFIQRFLIINIYRDMFFELAAVVFFLFLNFSLPFYISFYLYLLFLLFLILIKKKDLILFFDAFRKVRAG